MGGEHAVTPEDDLFGRIAVFNRLATSSQVAECAGVLTAEAGAGRQPHSLASVLIGRGYLSPESAAAVEQEARRKAVAQAGEAPPLAPGLEPRPRPMKRRAHPGESQIIVPIKAEPGRGDRRLRISSSASGETATLEADCDRLSPADGPAFEAACCRLLQAGQPNLVIDLSKVRHLSSAIVAELSRANVEAEAAGKRLVVLASEEIAPIIRLFLGDLTEVRTGGG